ncbi:SIR2 family protein [Fimbriiglobus ruber]|uniref:Uncharacterized protein n=1 Tax=Fimbriiglobus ruber TaxID=1908690 RepID=A0A225DYF8_9BACT|nr:SIR2 family protein [Fimbriiglobus ruber]OWK46570.1 hypothetical protein FRUB_00269 [Fimbriiglobus ruber]
MNIDELKRTLQNHFTDGLVLIVGSGLSMAEGIPGMKGLGDYLGEHVANGLENGALVSEWQEINADIKSGIDLESALSKHNPTTDIVAAIVLHTANFIRQHECRVVKNCIKNRKEMRLTRLLPHLVIPAAGLPVITTNYDRLIECAVEKAGKPADSMFVGHYSGIYEPETAKYICAKSIQIRGRKHNLKWLDRIRLYKPHGSLDWYRIEDETIRCSLELDESPLIITPGLSKYAAGYHEPFDRHREKANDAIDNASRFLIIGYGFNDNHLETHLSQRLRDGKPAVIMAMGLTANAEKMIRESPKAIALVQGASGPHLGQDA